ncbi:MAG: TetR/AcrR family transcriptional regulator [Actinomycetota bacterium]
MSEEGATGLPPYVLSAWGRQPRRTKGPHPELSLSRIVEAAIRIADQDGLGAVSMGRVAQAVGSSTMALYRHVGGKDELVTLMVDTSYGMPPKPPTADGWRSGLSHWAWSSRAAMQKHRWGVRVPIQGPPMTPCQLAWLEQGLAALRDTPLTESQKLSTMLLVSGYVRNEVSVGIDLDEGFLAGGGGDDPMRLYRRVLEQLTDKTSFPSLHAVIAAGVLEQTDDPDDEFDFGLERLLDGIEALVVASAPVRRRRRT